MHISESENIIDYNFHSLHHSLAVDRIKSRSNCIARHKSNKTEFYDLYLYHTVHKQGLYAVIRTCIVFLDRVQNLHIHAVRARSL